MFKRVCFICGKKSERQYPICFSCRPKPLSSELTCDVCGIPTSKIIKCCSSCIDIKSEFKKNYSLFYYSGLPKEILTQYKFKKDHSISLFFAELIIEYLKNNFNNPILCPVPTSFIKRKIKNGYQLDNIVKDLKKAKVDVKYLLKKRYTKTQKKLNRNDRILNLTNSFILKNRVPLNRPIILFDDVFTTGATINACAKILNKMNESIYSITLYRD